MRQENEAFKSENRSLKVDRVLKDVARIASESKLASSILLRDLEVYMAPISQDGEIAALEAEVKAIRFQLNAVDSEFKAICVEIKAEIKALEEENQELREQNNKLAGS